MDGPIKIRIRNPCCLLTEIDPVNLIPFISDLLFIFILLLNNYNKKYVQLVSNKEPKLSRKK